MTETLHEAWRARQLTPNVMVLRQRSGSGLTANIYALPAADGSIALVDAGFPNRTDDLADALGALGHSLAQVSRVFYTHTHIDHMGGGPALAARQDAEHVVWHESLGAAEDWPAHQARLEAWGPWTRQVVDEPDVLAAWFAHYERRQPERQRQRQGPRRIAPVLPLYPGQRVAAGTFALEAIAAPGHDPHHIILWDRERAIAFTGDVVLPIATPLSTAMGDDTATYLATLDRLGQLPIEVAYPGHGAPLTQFPRRIEHSRREVESRCRAILDRVDQQHGASLLDLARALAGEAATDMARFPIILANVESSVQYLHQTGQVERRGARVHPRPSRAAS